MAADAREAAAKPLRTGWSGQRDGEAAQSANEAARQKNLRQKNLR
jgi:hypothetical protein